jgi:trigger factor
MNTSLHVVSEIEVRIEVELPSEKVDRELDRQLGEFGKRARVRGFRPGKAPKDLVRKSFAQEIATEATRKLINDSFQEAASKVGDRLVGEPQVEPGLARQGEPLKYAIRAQVKPRVEVHSWKNVEVAVTPATVLAEEMNRRIAALQEQHKERVPVEDRNSDTGDTIIIETQGYVEGKRDTRLDLKNFEVRIGGGQMIPGFEDELIGLTVGDKKTFEVTFPADYRGGDLGGKLARFDASVQGLFREEAPEVDDEFASDLGFSDLEALKQDLHDKILADAEKRRKEETERKVLTAVLERNTFPVPPAMVEAFLGERARNLVRMFKAQGLPEDQAIRIVQQNLQGLQASAEFEARRYLVLEGLARQEKLTVEEDELSEAIVGKIKERGESVAKVYERPEMREALRAEMLERRALDLILESASIVDAPVAPAAPAEG